MEPSHNGTIEAKMLFDWGDYLDSWNRYSIWKSKKLAISKLPYASVSNRILAQNFRMKMSLIYKNERAGEMQISYQWFRTKTRLTQSSRNGFS